MIVEPRACAEGPDHGGVPGIGVADLRGNVETRLRKLADGEVDARSSPLPGSPVWDRPPHATPLGIDVMIPRRTGVPGIQCRTDDREVLAVLMLLDHRPSRMALEASGR